MEVFVGLLFLAIIFFVYQLRSFIKNRNEVNNPIAHSWRVKWSSWSGKEEEGK